MRGPVKLSVVMAVRDGELYVREAIESVLAQSVGDFEFLIVDDASTDNTPGILSEYERRDSRIRVLRNDTNLGPFPSANRGFTEARGEFIARHDADDISPPERFAIQLEALDSSPDVTLVTGAFEVFEGERRRTLRIGHSHSWQPRLEWELLFTNDVGAGGHVMFPRILRGTPVLFPSKYAFSEDYGMWCRLARLGRVVCPAEVIYYYRKHGASISSRMMAAQQECFTAMRHEYQSPYLRSEVSREASEKVARFWAMRRFPFGDNTLTIGTLLAELRLNFLVYVGERFGPKQRTDLDAELDAALSERLGYWLYRSIRFRDRKACADLLSLGAGRGVVAVSRTALGKATRVLRRTLGRALYGRA